MVMMVVYCCAVVMVATLQLAVASDADPINDYCVADLACTLKLNGLPCKNPANVTGEDFAFRGFEKVGDVAASPIGVAIAPGFAGVNQLNLNLNITHWLHPLLSFYMLQITSTHKPLDPYLTRSDFTLIQSHSSSDRIGSTP